MKEKCKNKKTQKTPKKQKQKKTKAEKKKGDRCRYYCGSGRTKWFCCAFKLCFPQLICKTLSLSIFLKQRELYESKHVAMECRCSKIWDLLSFLICSSILVLKWRHVSPIKLKLQLAQVNLYTRKYFKSSGIGSLFEK